MKVKVCSAFNDEKLERKIQQAIDDCEEQGLKLKDISYSTSAVSPVDHIKLDSKTIENCFLKSAVLIFG